ncbi:DUF6231 family protein [Marinobacteraceae bacterium S3BR75-40.1]
MTLDDELLGLIANCQPGSLLTCGSTASRVASQWAEHHPDCQVTALKAAEPNRAFPLPRQHDLALVTDTLENLPHDEGELLLGQLRNFGARQIAVLVAHSESWRFQDFLGLGFKRQKTLTAEPPCDLYTYDIRTYNHKRTWNNPKYWANPEMWDKARW